MSITVVITTVGEQCWADLARDRAEPSVDLGPTDALYMLHVPTASALVLGAARNRAAEEAPPSEWLCFLDADDELAPGYLQAMADAIERREAAAFGILQGDLAGRLPEGLGEATMDAIARPALLIPSIQYVRAGQEPEEPLLPAWGRQVLDVNTAVIGTLIPRALFLELEGFQAWPIYEDWDLWLRALTAGAQPIAVPDAIYRAHVSPGSRNQQPDEGTYWQIRRRHEAALAGRVWA